MRCSFPFISPRAFSAPRLYTLMAVSSFLLICVAFPKLVLAHGPLHVQIVEVTKLIAQHPDSAELYLKRGELHRHHSDWQAALGDYHSAESLDPGLAAVDLCRGKMLLEAGQPEAARSALNRFLAKAPDDGDGLLTRARVLAQCGEHLAAAADFSRALPRLSTPQPEYYLEHAQALCAAGCIDEALHRVDEGLLRLGQVVTLQLFAIDLEVKRQRYDTALSRLELIAAQSPRKEKWLLRRGEILQMAGRHEEARLAFQSALREIESLPAARRGTKATVELEQRLRAAL